MATEFYTLLTAVGKAKIANAIALNQTVALTQMAVGDGNGNPTTPSEGQTALVREVYRLPITRLQIDADNANYIVAEGVVPTSVGGWTAREVGIFDTDGNLFAIANFPATYKPVISEGSGRDLVIRIIMQVSNSSVIQLVIDPTVVIASRQWVVDNFSIAEQIPGGLTNQILTKKSNADGDVEWKSPSGFEFIVSGRTEAQELAADQTEVTLAVVGTQGMALYIEGAREFDFVVTSPTSFTLGRSYPPGTRIWAVQNDPMSEVTAESVIYQNASMVSKLPFPKATITQPFDFNDEKLPCVKYVNIATEDVGWAATQNKPLGATWYGTLQVFVTGGIAIHQFYYPADPHQTNYPKAPFYRMGFVQPNQSVSWLFWNQLLDSYSPRDIYAAFTFNGIQKFQEIQGLVAGANIGVTNGAGFLAEGPGSFQNGIAGGRNVVTVSAPISGYSWLNTQKSTTVVEFGAVTDVTWKIGSIKTPPRDGWMMRLVYGGGGSGVCTLQLGLNVNRGDIPAGYSPIALASNVGGANTDTAITAADLVYDQTADVWLWCPQ